MYPLVNQHGGLESGQNLPFSLGFGGLMVYMYMCDLATHDVWRKRR